MTKKLNLYYYLDENKNPVPCSAEKMFAEGYEGDIDARIVARDVVGDFPVSTTFMGIDHDFTSKGPPILFETMVFLHPQKELSDWEELAMDRYSTWDEAVEGHKEMVELVMTKGWQKEHARS